MEKRFGWLGIPHLPTLIVALQAACFMLGLLNPEFVERLMLDPTAIRGGEAWRLITFVFVPFIPPSTNLLDAVFVVLVWRLFQVMGNELEAMWGRFKFTSFLLIGMVLTASITLLLPAGVGVGGFAGNEFVYLSVFLAFAFRFPNYELWLLFLFPVRIKWLALLAWIGLFLKFIVAGAGLRLLIVAAVTNWILFFWADAVRLVRRELLAHKRQGPGSPASRSHEAPRGQGVSLGAPPPLPEVATKVVDPLEWFYDNRGVMSGPLSLKGMRMLFESGTIGKATRVWRQGMADWKPLGESELAALI